MNKSSWINVSKNLLRTPVLFVSIIAKTKRPYCNKLSYNSSIVVKEKKFRYICLGSRTIIPEENCPRPPTLTLTLTVTQTVTLSGGQFSLGAIVRTSFVLNYIKKVGKEKIEKPVQHFKKPLGRCIYNLVFNKVLLAEIAF